MRGIEKVLEGCPPVSRLADDGIVDERSAESFWGEEYGWGCAGKAPKSVDFRDECNLGNAGARDGVEMGRGEEVRERGWGRGVWG
jgi:hypothetical protein